MDIFKEHKAHQCGPAGPKCPCCNTLHGKDRKKLNRLARAKIKATDIKQNKERE